MRPALALTTLLALTCTAPQAPTPPPTPPPVPTAPAPIPLHELEQRRDSAALLALPDRGPAVLTALARIGDRQALDALLAILRADDPRPREHAARALGIAALLDADPTGLEPALLSAWPRADLGERVAIAEALGRLGSAAALDTLRGALAPTQPAPLRSAAAIALGVLGRRKHPHDLPTREALLAALGTLPYPALYALANEPDPPADPTLLAALRTHARAADPELQRLALAGLIRRSAAPPLQACLARELLTAARDPDTLTALLAPDRELALTALFSWARSTLARDPSLADTRQLHAALHCLASDTTAPTRAQRRALEQLRAALQLDPATHDPRTQTLARIDCQLAQRLAHSPTWRPPLTCGQPPLDPETRTLAELSPLLHGFGGPDRLARIDAALTADAAANRIAAVAALGPLWTDPATTTTVHTWLLRALNDPVLGVLGAAADVITAHHSATPRHTAMSADDPLAQRLTALGETLRDRDPELHSTLLAALAATRIPAALALCEASRAHPSPAVRKAARACITELTRTDPGPQSPTAAIPAPPVDPTQVLGKTVVWTLITAVGDLSIDLDPAAAPWAVAAIVALTRRGFYDNLRFHRDVPGFVLQGGDPEGTGWGGPGFVLPSEPSPHRFDRGAVGIADAGKDTGGSQFFLMYARAPHLEGRYTWIGRLRPEHLDRLDLLTLGDTILSARVELSP